jgi:hypothetical protein
MVQPEVGISIRAWYLSVALNSQVGFLFRFKVAVVQPDLQELLANTPTDIFTTVWVRWHEIPLYYIHYTELLRLVALYK